MHQRLPILVTSLQVFDDLIDRRCDVGCVLNRTVAHFVCFRESLFCRRLGLSARLRFPAGVVNPQAGSGSGVGSMTSGPRPTLTDPDVPPGSRFGYCNQYRVPDSSQFGNPLPARWAATSSLGRSHFRARAGRETDRDRFPPDERKAGDAPHKPALKRCRSPRQPTKPSFDLPTPVRGDPGLARGKLLPEFHNGDRQNSRPYDDGAGL